MVNWNPVSMFNNRQQETQDVGVDTNNRSTNDGAAMSNSQNHEQESTHIGQNSNAEPQREPLNVFPSDFGGYVLHPENKSNQSSDFANGPDDMVVRQDRSKDAIPSPPGYATKPDLTHDKDIVFFGDSNTTEPYSTSRSTLDQTGLQRGSVSTMPYAGDRRRRSSAQSSERRGSTHQRGVPISGLGGVHAPENATSAAANVNVPIGENALSTDNKVSSLPSDKLNSIDDSSDNTTARKTSLPGMASAAVTGVAAAAAGATAVATGAAATLLGTNTQTTVGPNDSKMPSAWPESNIHGQTPYSSCENKQPSASAIQDSAHLQDDPTKEPSIHGQNPSFFCENKQHDCKNSANTNISGLDGAVVGSNAINNKIAVPQIMATEPQQTPKEALNDSPHDGANTSELDGAVGSNAINNKMAVPQITTSQPQQAPKEALDDSLHGSVAKSGGIAAALGGLLGLHHRSSSQSQKSVNSQDTATRENLIHTPESNNINAVYQTNAQGVNSNQINAANPVFTAERNNIDDVYKTHAQGVIADQVTDRSPTPTTALYENDIRDVYRTNAEGTTQNMITPGNPTVSYHENNIQDVYRTTPRNLTPETSTPRYAGTPRQGASLNHDKLVAAGGIGAAVGGILGVHHHSNQHLDNKDSLSPADASPLNHTIDQKPITDVPMDNNAHPQQMHSATSDATSNVPKDRATDPLHPQTGSAGPAPVLAGNLNPQSCNSATDPLHPQTGSAGPAPVLAGNLNPQSLNSATDPLHPQTGSAGPAPVLAGSLNPQSLNSSTTTPVIAGSTGTPIPGNMDRSKGSFSSTRAITGTIVPSPAPGAVLSSSADQGLNSTLAKHGEPKRKTSLTDGIKSAFRRMSLKSDKKKDGRRLSAAEAFKKQTLTKTEKSTISAPIATTAGITDASAAAATAVPAVPSHQIQQLPPPNKGFVIKNNDASGTTSQNYARIPDVSSLKPVGTVNVSDNGELNFIKLNDGTQAEALTKGAISEGKSEHRRASIQETVGKIFGKRNSQDQGTNMQDKGTFSQVSDVEKTNSYNAQSHPTNLNNF